MSQSPLEKLNEDQFEAIAGRFRALSEPSRLKIIAFLQDGEKSVSEIVQQTGLSQPNVSRHLTTLLNGGLIARQKQGNSVYYRIIDPTLAEICSIVCKSICEI